MCGGPEEVERFSVGYVERQSGEAAPTPRITNPRPTREEIQKNDLPTEKRAPRRSGECSLQMVPNLSVSGLRHRACSGPHRALLARKPFGGVAPALADMMRRNKFFCVAIPKQRATSRGTLALCVMRRDALP